MAVDVYRQGWVEGRRNVMLLEEALEEMNRLKSKRSVNSSVYALLMVHCLLSLFAMAMPVHWIHATIHA